MTKDLERTPSTTDDRLLTQTEFRRLADVPPEIEWFANLKNPITPRAYRNVVMHYAKNRGSNGGGGSATTVWFMAQRRSLAL